MTKVIWKYNVDLTNEVTIKMPIGAEILAVQNQHDIPRIWVLVDPDAEQEVRTFYIHGTDHEVTDVENKKFIGTFQYHGGDLAFHLFEVEN